MRLDNVCLIYYLKNNFYMISNYKNNTNFFIFYKNNEKVLTNGCPSAKIGCNVRN